MFPTPKTWTATLSDFRVSKASRDRLRQAAQTTCGGAHFENRKYFSPAEHLTTLVLQSINVLIAS